jgi:cardiolipin synthase
MPGSSREREFGDTMPLVTVSPSSSAGTALEGSHTTEGATTHPLLDPAFERETDRYSGTAVREGNGVLFLPSGAASFERRWALIEGAQKSIDLVSFSMMRDATTRKLVDLLVAKLKQGVRVRIILDDAIVYTTRLSGWVGELERAGATVLRYHRVFRDVWPDFNQPELFQQAKRIVMRKVKRRFHEKYSIIDGRQAILGGINWGDKYAYGGLRPKAWRDTDVLLSGPIVADVQRQFVRDFFLYSAMEREPAERVKPGFDLERYYEGALSDAEGYEAGAGVADFPSLPEAGGERVRYVPHKPYDQQKLRMTEAVLLMIKQARRYIYWGCHGIRPPRILAESLAEAVERGVDVKLVTNGTLGSRTLMFYGLLGWMYWESSNHFPWLVEHGIHVLEWQRPGAFHSKNLVIDDVVASVGSYNIASGSAFHHTESNVVVYGGDFPLMVRKQFETDFADCRELRREDLRVVAPQHRPHERLLHERNLLVPRELRTAAINEDLDAGRYKRS